MRIACYVTAVAFRRSPILVRPDVSNTILEELEHYRAKRSFRLCGFVIMPDHWHWLMISEQEEISPILRDMKSMISRLSLDRLQKTADAGPIVEKLRLPTISKRRHEFSLWQPGNWKVLIEDANGLERRLTYIHANPIRAGLVDRPEHWRLSSYRWYMSREAVGVTIDMDWAM